MVNNKRLAFISEYLHDFNATRAAQAVGYSAKTAYSQGQRLLKNVEVARAIKERLDAKAMTADEVLQRLAEHARGDIGEFVDIESMSFDLDLAKAKEAGITRLIKRVKQRTVTTSARDGSEDQETNVLEIELYDAQAALALLGKYHGLFIDRTDVTTKGESINPYMQTDLDELLNLIKRIAENAGNTADK